MQKILLTTTLLAGSLLLGACAREAGGGDMQARYGEATSLTFARQVAYKSPEDFLTDMGRAFAAEAQDTATFAFNSAELDSTARAVLDGQAAWLKANPEVRMSVTGHADAVGGESYNDRLGLRRARAVVAYLVRKGVARDRLDAIESLGERALVVPTTERERRNRRTVTQVSGFDRNYVGDGMDGRIAERLYLDYRTAAKRVAAASSDTGD